MPNNNNPEQAGEFLRRKLTALTRKPRILIIDDEPNDRFLLRRLLERYNLEVMECGDGQQAPGLIIDGDYNIVFLDVKLPPGDGVEVFKQVKAVKPDQTIIIMTAYDDVAIREKLLEISPQFMWRKPIKALDLDNIFETLKPNA